MQDVFTVDRICSAFKKIGAMVMLSSLGLPGTGAIVTRASLADSRLRHSERVTGGGASHRQQQISEMKDLHTRSLAALAAKGFKTDALSKLAPDRTAHQERAQLKAAAARAAAEVDAGVIDAPPLFREVQHLLQARQTAGAVHQIVGSVAMNGAVVLLSQLERLILATTTTVGKMTAANDKVAKLNGRATEIRGLASVAVWKRGDWNDMVKYKVQHADAATQARLTASAIAKMKIAELKTELPALLSGYDTPDEELADIDLVIGEDPVSGKEYRLSEANELRRKIIAADPVYRGRVDEMMAPWRKATREAATAAQVSPAAPAPESPGSQRAQPGGPAVTEWDGW